MNKYNPLYTLLLVLLIMGAFSSMAQNDYGQTILGFVAFAFSLLFCYQLLVFRKSKELSPIINILELLSLILLSAILGMRVFYIHFQFVEVIFAVAGLTLIIVYIVKLSVSWNFVRSMNKRLGIFVALFYLSIIFYSISMAIVPFIPSIAEPAGGTGFFFLILFVGLSLASKQFMIDGEKISSIRFVSRFRDRSVLLITLFLIFTAYMGLTKIEILPKMYSDEFPQVYFKMVNDAEMGKEEPIDGKYKHERFKEKYDEFVSRQSGSDKK